MLPLLLILFFGPSLQDPPSVDPGLNAARGLPVAEARKLIAVWREAAAASPSLSFRWAFYSAEDGRPAGGIELDSLAEGKLRLRFQRGPRNAATLWADLHGAALLLEDPDRSRRGAIHWDVLEGFEARLERLMVDAARLAGADEQELGLGSLDRSWRLPWLRLADDGRSISVGFSLQPLAGMPGGLFWIDWLAEREDWEARADGELVDFRGPGWRMRVDRADGLLQGHWVLEQGEWRLVIQETRGAVLGTPVPSDRFDPLPFEEGMHDLDPEIARAIELVGLVFDRWELFLGALRERLTVGDGWSGSHGEAWREVFLEIYGDAFRLVHELGGSPELEVWLQREASALAMDGARAGWQERESDYRASAATAVLPLIGKAMAVVALGLRQAAAAAGSLAGENSPLSGFVDKMAQLPAGPERQVLLLERRALERAAIDLALGLLRERLESVGLMESEEDF